MLIRLESVRLDGVRPQEIAVKPHAVTIARRSMEIGPHAGAHTVALRAAFCLAVPLLILNLLGRSDLAIYAAFGSLNAVYGRAQGYADRLTMQAAAGTIIVLSMLTGTFVAYTRAPDQLRVVVVAIIAAGVTAIAHRLNWKPTGATFAVFSAGACATIPATAISLAQVLLVGGGTMIFSLVVTALLALRRIPAKSLMQPAVKVELQPRHLIHVVMVFSATLLAGWTALLIFEHHWYWAMVAATAMLVGADTHAKLARGFQRFLGTALGVALAAMVMWLGPPVFVVFAIAIVCQGLIELIVLRNYALAMVLITVSALIMVHLASPIPAGTLIRNRLLETLLGVIAGMAVTVVVQAMDLE